MAELAELGNGQGSERSLETKTGSAKLIYACKSALYTKKMGRFVELFNCRF